MTFRLSDEEFARFQSLADARGVPARTLIRDLALTALDREARSSPESAQASEMARILEMLEASQTRATYGAVGEHLGLPAVAVSRLLGRRRPRASWVVSAKDYRPSGYVPDQEHPGLYSRPDRVLLTGVAVAELLRDADPAPTAKQAATEIDRLQATPSLGKLGRSVRSLGIDVSQRRLHLAELQWERGVPTDVRFSHCSFNPRLDIQALRVLVGNARLDRLAEITYPAAAEVAERFAARLGRLDAVPAGIFIDAPSGFSRNTKGHGRRSEKLHLPGVVVQSTPSVSCGREHRGHWVWMLVGFATFLTASRMAPFSPEDWNQALRDGLYETTRSGTSPTIRECFPTATIASIRLHRREAEVATLLRPLQATACDPEAVALVLDYLERGVRAVKQVRQECFDYADALVAALGLLPHVRSDFDEVELVPGPSARWLGGQGDEEREGRIAVVR